MIFVTVGTEKFPFDRLLKAIDKGIENRQINEEVFAQIGNSKYDPQFFKYKNFLSFDEMIRAIQKSSIVIPHAGIGSVFLSLNLGKVPIIFPRFVHLGEHLDNHQVEFAKEMEKEGKVLAAYDEKDLIYKIKNYSDLISQLKSFKGYSNKDSLVNYLREICIKT